MIAVKPIDPVEIPGWGKRAAEATSRVIDPVRQGKKPRFDERVWREVKPRLLERFHGKCAFCESRIVDVSFGDIEHFRPKSLVSEDADHPGYYWCAYDLSNLLPTCQLCNQHSAKRGRFPIAGQRAYSPSDDLLKEEPLLLNPYMDDPENHLMFAEDGFCRGATERGRVTIEVFSLNRPARRSAKKRGGDHTPFD
jgi:uncharacterized protein (TIGR02646 family)